jgi:hypothetical protein
MIQLDAKGVGLERLRPSKNDSTALTCRWSGLVKAAAYKIADIVDDDQVKRLLGTAARPLEATSLEPSYRNAEFFPFQVKGDNIEVSAAILKLHGPQSPLKSLPQRIHKNGLAGASSESLGVSVELVKIPAFHRAKPAFPI